MLNEQKIRQMVLGSTSSAILLAAAAVPAQAQEQVTPGFGLEEIVVTAQKQEESLQSVPIAVSAIGSGAIEQRNMVTLQALQGSVPNLQISGFANTPEAAVVSVRGIGVIEVDPYAGNTVSIVVDGVPQFFSLGALVDLYDVNRVEVLRGPQGTLFGANTTGGVVNVVSERPSGEFGGKAEFGLGNHDRLSIAAAVDIPIVEDRLSGRFTVSHLERDGFYTNVVDGSDMGSLNTSLMRAHLRYDGGGDFAASLVGEYTRGRNGAPVVINGAYATEVAPDGIYVAPGVDGMYQQPCLPGGRCTAPDQYFSANDSVPDINDMNTYRAALTLEWFDTPVGDVTAITGYKHFDLHQFTDQDGTPHFLADTERDTKGWQLSQEIRTAAEITDFMRVIAGGFFMKTHYDHWQGFRIQFATPGLLQINEQNQDNWSASLFAQSYIDVTDRLQIQAGIRYTHEETKMLASTITSLDPGGVSDFAGLDNIILASVAPPRGKESWKNFGWKLGLDYQLDDATLAYGSWARGFKSGGFTGRLGIAADLGPYDPEKVDTFEIGLKTDFFDNRLRTNVAAFYTNYRDLQVGQIYFDNSTGQPVQGNSILNAGKAEIKGVEAEIAAAPLAGLLITGSVAYLDATYKDFPYIDPISLTSMNLRGLHLQNSPEWSASAGVTYDFEVGPGSATAHLFYSFVDEKYLSSIRNTPRSLVQATHLVDGSLSWAPYDEAWSISAWVRNLFDNRYIAFIHDQPPYGGFGTYAAPREYGVTLKVNW